MKEQEKLRLLIPHWIEHNEAHAGEFRRWVDAAGSAAPDILAAAEALAHANAALSAALTKLGGALKLDPRKH